MRENAVAEMTIGEKWVLRCERLNNPEASRSDDILERLTEACLLAVTEDYSQLIFQT